MKSYQYAAIRVQQQPEAVPFYILTARADELLEWSDVPRKKAEFMAGYQRGLLDRHSNITDFIQKDPANIIPGAIIVAIPGDFVEIADAGTPGVVNLSVQVPERTFEERLESLADEFIARLGDTERASIGSAPPTDDIDALEAEQAEEAEEVPPESYLAKLALELRQAVTAFDSLQPERQSAVRNFVEGSSKPGRILDGQHRVFGAKDVSEFDVYLPVVLLPSLATSEQVFHFYVLNNKAQPLTPTQLRATISTSLSNAEIGFLYDRFKQAGITEAESARWTHRANTEPASPFAGLISFGLIKGQGVIPENVAYQLITKFVKLPKKYRLLYDKVPSWKGDTNYDYRLALFFSLWNAIKSKYPDAWEQAVQDGKGQILTKAGMLVLQELVLDRLNTSMPGRSAKDEPSPFADPEELAAAVKAELYFLPEDFFLREWQEKQLDTTDRRKFLLGQMNEAIMRAGAGLGHLPLFKPKST